MQPTEAKPYTEKHAALTWPLLALGLFVPGVLCLACLILAIIINPAWLIGAVVVPFLLPFLVYIGMLHRNWPSGIRIDTDGIRIGAVASANAVYRAPTVTRQAWGLFHAPWTAVRRVEVIDDPVELRRLRNSPEYFTLCNRWGKPRTVTHSMTGVLLSSFARAALFITLDGESTETPRLGASNFFPNEPGRPLRTRLTPAYSYVWIAPTRHPDRLRAALESWTGEP